ncbi:uncharacterized protein LOC128276509, partial [Anopheles cruzii]|uniref:uncharacterized protein LOC128276509 n=1 Tax=Anopheles cruzii TaxID=68878 RepID=UPI0022EC51D4
MGRLSIRSLFLVLVVCVSVKTIAGQKSRVCFAGSSDYSTNTALGFCSQAVYISLSITGRGLIGLINPANDASGLLGGIGKFAARQTAFPNVEFYLGAIAVSGTTTWMLTATSRTALINLLLLQLQDYPQLAGLFIDFQGLTASYTSAYSSFMADLYTVLTANNLKLASALPWDASSSADIYFSATLPKLAFNAVKTYEDMYTSLTTVTHPLNPLFAMSSPFNIETSTIYNNVFRWVIKGIPTTNLIIGLSMYSLKFTATNANAFGMTATAVATDTYCNALLFASTNTLGASQAGEGFAYSSSTFYTFNTFASINDKLTFATATNMGGVGVYSLDQAGSTNAELLRFITSVLAPTPPTGVTYPAAETATCGSPITFPASLTTTASATTTTSAITTTTAGGTTAAGGGSTTAAGGGTTAPGGGTTAAGG